MKESRGAALSQRFASKFPLLFIAIRYLSVKSQARSIAIFSMLSLALGIAGILIVLSVMNGFQHLIHERILGVIPHVYLGDRVKEGVLLDAGHEEGQAISGALKDALQADERVQSIMPFVQSDALLSYEDVVQPLSLYAVDAKMVPQTSFFREMFVVGSVDDLEEGGVALGAPLMSRLGLVIGDRVRFLIPSYKYGRIELMPVVERVVAGFESKYVLDSSLAIVHLNRYVNALQGQSNSANAGWHIRLHDVEGADVFVEDFRGSVLLQGRDIKAWSEVYGGLFSALKLEKMVMFILMLFIVSISSFGMIASQMMLIRKKSGDIHILQSFGATKTKVMQVFLFQGSALLAIGVTIGVLLGCFGALLLPTLSYWVASLVGYSTFSGHYLAQLPVRFDYLDIVLVVLFSVFTCLSVLYFFIRKMLSELTACTLKREFG